MRTAELVINAFKETLETYLPDWLTTVTERYRDGTSLPMPYIYSQWEVDSKTVENFPHIRIEAVKFVPVHFLHPIVENQHHTVDVITTVKDENPRQLQKKLLRYTEAVYNTLRTQWTLGNAIEFVNAQVVNYQFPPFTKGIIQVNKSSQIRCDAVSHQEVVI